MGIDDNPLVTVPMRNWTCKGIHRFMAIINTDKIITVDITSNGRMGHISGYEFGQKFDWLH